MFSVWQQVLFAGWKWPFTGYLGLKTSGQEWSRSYGGQTVKGQGHKAKFCGSFWSVCQKKQIHQLWML